MADETGTCDTGIDQKGTGDTSTGDGLTGITDALREPLSPDLAASVQRLRNAKFYTDLLIRQGHQNARLSSPAISNPSGDGLTAGEIARFRREMSIEEREAKTRLARDVYNFDSTITYQSDKNALRIFLAEQAQSIGLAVIDHRKTILDSITERYLNPDNLDGLIKAASAFLAHRSFLPYCMPPSIENEGHFIGSESDNQILIPSPSPESSVDVEALIDTLVDNQPNRFESDNADPTDPYSGMAARGEDREKKKSWKRLMNRWSDWQATDPFPDHPFRDSVAYLGQIDANESSSARRKRVYQDHPVLLCIPFIATPYELADIVRQSDFATQATRMRQLLSRIIARFRESQAKLLGDMSVVNPQKIDWGDYEIFIKAAGSQVQIKQDDDINSLLEVLYADMNLLSYREIADILLLSATVVLICAAPFAAPGLGLMLATFAGAGITAGGLISAAENVREAIERNELLDRDQQFSLIDGDIRTIESAPSVNWAMLGLIIEVIGVIPLAKIAKAINTAKPAKLSRAKMLTAAETPPATRAIDPPASTPRAASERPAPIQPEATAPAPRDTAPDPQPLRTEPDATPPPQTRPDADDQPPTNTPPPARQAEEELTTTRMTEDQGLNDPPLPDNNTALASDPTAPSPWHQRGLDGQYGLPSPSDAGDTRRFARYTRIREAAPETLSAEERSFRRLLDRTHRGGIQFEEFDLQKRIWLETEYRQYPKLSADDGTIAEISKWGSNTRVGAVEKLMAANTGEMTALGMLHAEDGITSIRLVESGPGARSADFEFVLSNGDRYGLEVRTATRTPGARRGETVSRFDVEDKIRIEDWNQRPFRRSMISSGIRDKVRHNQLGTQQGFIMVIAEGDLNGAALLSPRQIANVERRLRRPANRHILGVRVVGSDGTRQIVLTIDNPTVTNMPITLHNMPAPNRSPTLDDIQQVFP